MYTCLTIQQKKQVIDIRGCLLVRIQLKVVGKTVKFLEQVNDLVVEHRV